MSESEMKIGAIAPWFGSKRSMAPEIVLALGPHTTYVEPFCGGMSVLLAKPPARVEVVNDLHGDLTNLARVLKHPIYGPKLYRAARRLIVSDAQMGESNSLIRHDTPPDEKLYPNRALAFFVSSWMGRNGEVGLKKSERGRKLAVRWNAVGGDPCTRYQSAVQSIPAWRRRLANVCILTRDGFDVLESVKDEPGVSVYVDPPYLEKSDEYAHDFCAADHIRLAKSIGRFKAARIVVSYYMHPKLKELYPGWEFQDHRRTKAMGSLAKKNGDAKKIAEEILIVNLPQEELFSPFLDTARKYGITT